jgi:hypothetical protein
MLTSRRLVTGVLAFAMAAGTCFCEDAESLRFYKLDFVVKEVQGTKILNSRAYSTVVSTGNSHGEIRAGSKLRYNSGGNQYQMVDVGASIDAYEVREVQNHLSLRIKAEISSVPEGASDNLGPSVIRQNTWGSTVIVPLKKPTLVFSSDNADAKSQMQIELTATPLP